MNKRAQEAIQQIPSVNHPSNKKLIIMAIVAVVIIALAVTAFVIFNKKAVTKVETPAAPTENQQAQQTLDSLSQNMTPEEKQNAEQTLNGLAQGMTPEQQKNAQDVLNSL